MDDVRLLAALVHRGHLDRSQAEALFPALQRGEELDALLMEHAGWSEETVARMRRTRGGEIPEIPGYDMLDPAGTGGTSDVFRARERKTRRVLALKVLKPAAAAHPPTRKAFVAEARMLERLRHPGLVRGFGVARSGRTYFARMEYVDGRTLLELLDGGRAFTEPEALGLVVEVARVLEYLEGEQIVHRDIKPGNIMLTGENVVKLIDLGFAAETAESAEPAAGAEGQADDTTVGTVAYLSPEQARGGNLADCRSDIYSLGVSLFHIAIGRLPFESSDNRELMRMQVMEHLSSPELKGRGFSPHLHYFIEKMMAKEAGHRYQSWAQLIEDVQAQLVGRQSLDFEADVRAGRQPGRGRPRYGRGRRGR